MHSVDIRSTWDHITAITIKSSSMSNRSDLYIDFYYFAAVNYTEGQRLRQSPSECIDVIYGHEARGMHSDKGWETLVIF